MTQGHHMTQGRPVRVRFAPSPTGLLHAGNARVALVNWLFARREGGRFILRLDDTDAERSTPEFAAAIEEDLLWLGLRWDEMVRQSDRVEHYREAFEALHAGGRLYPCYETPEELALARKRHRAAGAPPVYDRAALRLTAAAREALEAQGRRPHWRFLLEDRKVAWDDLVHGRLSFAAGSLSDPVLFRSDGRPLYTVTSAVDDIALEITHVIRGDDHIANSAAQAQLFEALGAPVPAFGHLPLLMDAGGGSLSKRLGSLSLRALRDDGIEPMAVNSLLATLGTSAPVAAHRSLSDLVAAFDFAKISRAGPRFDPEELRHLNAKLLHEMPFEAVRGRLAALGLADADARFWCAVRPNLARLDEAAEWWQVCFGDVRPVIRDARLTATAAALLPEGAWDESTWPAWTKAVAAATGAKGRNLFLPLRLALTGRDHGPELKTLLPMIGRARAQARLTGKTA